MIVYNLLNLIAKFLDFLELRGLRTFEGLVIQSTLYSRNYRMFINIVYRLTMAVNTESHFWTTKAFLPAMIKKNHGHVVTVASAAGIWLLFYSVFL